MAAEAQVGLDGLAIVVYPAPEQQAVQPVAEPGPGQADLTVQQAGARMHELLQRGTDILRAVAVDSVPIFEPAQYTDTLHPSKIVEVLVCGGMARSDATRAVLLTMRQSKAIGLGLKELPRVLRDHFTDVCEQELIDQLSQATGPGPAPQPDSVRGRAPTTSAGPVLYRVTQDTHALYRAVALTLVGDESSYPLLESLANDQLGEARPAQDTYLQREATVLQALADGLGVTIALTDTSTAVLGYPRHKDKRTLYIPAERQLPGADALAHGRGLPGGVCAVSRIQEADQTAWASGPYGTEVAANAEADGGRGAPLRNVLAPNAPAPAGMAVEGRLAEGLPAPRSITADVDAAIMVAAGLVSHRGFTRREAAQVLLRSFSAVVDSTSVLQRMSEVMCQLYADRPAAADHVAGLHRQQAHEVAEQQAHVMAAKAGVGSALYWIPPAPPAPPLVAAATPSHPGRRPYTMLVWHYGDSKDVMQAYEARVVGGTKDVSTSLYRAVSHQLYHREALWPMVQWAALAYRQPQAHGQATDRPGSAHEELQALADALHPLGVPHVAVYHAKPGVATMDARARDEQPVLVQTGCTSYFPRRVTAQARIGAAGPTVHAPSAGRRCLHLVSVLDHGSIWSCSTSRSTKAWPGPGVFSSLDLTEPPFETVTKDSRPDLFEEESADAGPSSALTEYLRHCVKCGGCGVRRHRAKCTVLSQLFIGTSSACPACGTRGVGRASLIPPSPRMK